MPSGKHRDRRTVTIAIVELLLMHLASAVQPNTHRRVTGSGLHHRTCDMPVIVTPMAAARCAHGASNCKCHFFQEFSPWAHCNFKNCQRSAARAARAALQPHGQLEHCAARSARAVQVTVVLSCSSRSMNLRTVLAGASCKTIERDAPLHPYCVVLA